MAEKGYFIISDISGYTSFLTKSELDHAQDILKSVFDTLTKNIEKPLKFSNFQGDAILMYAPEKSIVTKQSILHIIENIYFEFILLIKNMSLNTDCACNACKNIPNLDLKFFVHYGDYSMHKVAGREELSGSDVILVHRLMKNRVVEKTGKKAYVLFSEKAFNELGLEDFCDALIPHTENYEDLGDLNTYVHCLHSAKEKRSALENKVNRVQKEEAWVSFEDVIPIPAVNIWDYMTNEKNKIQWMGMNDVSKGGGKKYGVGTTYHCVHDGGSFKYRVVDFRPFDYLTVEGEAGGFLYTQTNIIECDGDQCNFAVYVKPRYKNFFHKLLNKRNADKVHGMFQEMYSAVHSNLKPTLMKDVETGTLEI